MRQRKIYWRNEIDSFLSPLSERMLTLFFEDELREFIQGVKAGEILDAEEFRKRFHYMEVQPDGSKKYLVRPEAANYKIVYQQLFGVDEKLRMELGQWIPAGFFSRCVNDKVQVYRNPATVTESVIPVIVRHAYDKLAEAHSGVDKYLKELHLNYPLKENDPPDRLMEVMKKGAEKIVADEMENTSCDDCWWWQVDEYTVAYLESVSFMIDDVQMETLSGNHFSSWVEPDEDVMQAYLDELSAICIKQLFGDKYG